MPESLLKDRKSHCCFFFSSTLSGLHETLALLTSQLRPDSNHREEMGFLRDVFSEKSLSYLMKVKAGPALPTPAIPNPKGGSPCGISATSLPHEGSLTH